jgi:hypothetical protein
VDDLSIVTRFLLVGQVARFMVSHVQQDYTGNGELGRAENNSEFSGQGL